MASLWSLTAAKALRTNFYTGDQQKLEVPVPVPERETSCGLFVTLSVKATDPFTSVDSDVPPKMVTGSICQILLCPEVNLGRDDRRVPERKLDLLQ
jgi:hypothetical protein